MSRVGINTHPRKDTDLGLLTQTSIIIHYMGWQGATGFRDHTGISPTKFTAGVPSTPAI